MGGQHKGLRTPDLLFEISSMLHHTVLVKSLSESDVIVVFANNVIPNNTTSKRSEFGNAAASAWV